MTLPKLLGFLTSTSNLQKFSKDKSVRPRTSPTEVRLTKDKSVDSKPIISDDAVLNVEEFNDEEGHTREDGQRVDPDIRETYAEEVRELVRGLFTSEASLGKEVSLSTMKSDATWLRTTSAYGAPTPLSGPPSDLGFENALKNLNKFVGENARTISRASTTRSGGLTARSVNSACSGRPLSKVLREIEAIPCEMDDDLYASVHVSAHASELEDDDLQRPPRILTARLSDVEKFIDANAGTVSAFSARKTYTLSRNRSGNLTARSVNSACSSRPITKIMRDIDAL